MKNSNAEGVIILIILIIVVIVMPKSGSPTKSQNSGNTPGTTATSAAPKPSSNYIRNINVSQGNAPYSYQPYEEYINISSSSRDPINITGWQLKNAKDKRPYNTGGTNLKYFPRDVAIIPQGTLFISPTGTNMLQDIVLEVGDTAIITTGKLGIQTPYKITSFKENICSGYLEDMNEYQFTPPLARNCPRPSKELGVENLDSECRTFIERLPQCQTPKFDTRDNEGNICSNCVNGKPLSSACVAFAKSHFNYASCIYNHRYDENFSGNIWRIFLGQGWEMWAEDYETISLFDQAGSLVVERSY